MSDGVDPWAQPSERSPSRDGTQWAAPVNARSIWSGGWTVRRWLALTYVVVVAALAAVSFSDPNATGFRWTEALAFLVTLPAMVGGVIVVFVVGAMIWNVTNAGDGGGPMWPVTAVYTLMFAAIAVVNLSLMGMLVGWRRARRERRAWSSD